MSEQRILMGVVGRPHGVRGLVHVTSYTEDPAALSRYSPLSDDQGRAWRVNWRAEGVAELIDAKGAKITDRDQAAALTNTRLYAARDLLPETDDEEYYLADLIGLAVKGEVTGKVRQVHDYGAGASLEIETADGASLLVPFTKFAVPVVDLAAGMVEVVLPDEIIVEAAADQSLVEAEAS